MPAGLTWDGNTLWLSDVGETWGDGKGRIYQLSNDGAVISWFQLPKDIQIPRDLAYDGVHIWLVDQSTRRLFKISTTGAIIDTLDLSDDIGIPGNPYGLTWDGSSLWLSTESPDVVYQLKPTTRPPCTLDLFVTYDGVTLTVDFLLGSEVPVTWNTWLIVDGFSIPLWSMPLPPFPTTSFSIPIPGFPDLGVIGVLTTFDGPGGIICWGFDIADTSPPD